MIGLQKKNDNALTNETKFNSNIIIETKTISSIKIFFKNVSIYTRPDVKVILGTKTGTAMVSDREEKVSY